jgi:large subunit ribosomal protein L25
VPCLVREVQRHPVSREILHVDFYAVPQDREIELMVPLNPVGRPKGAVAGGRLRIIRRDLKVAARYDRIPKTVDIDVSDLDVGDFVRASQIKTPEGVSIVIANDFNVVAMEGKRAEEQAAPAAAAPAAPTEEPKA